MSLELRQSLKLSQQLIMTPQLQQAIKLLQLSRLDLIDTVHNELLENPLLEERPAELKEEVADDRSEPRSDIYEKEVALSADWENYLGEFASTPKGMSLRDQEQAEELSTLEGRIAESPTLAGHLLWQLRLSDLTDKQKDIGEIIIGNLDASGYLQATVTEIATMASTSEKEAADVLHAVQRFDPVGVAATSSSECLLIQIEVLGYSRDHVLVDIIEHHLEDLENHRYKQILRKHHMDEDELRDYLDIIQSLDPIPGARFGNETVITVSPDAYVLRDGNDFHIILNDEGLPLLSLSPDYLQLADKADDRNKEYFSEKLRTATWLIKSLHQRQRTLYKVIESIVNHQRLFFEHGVSRLKPLVLRDIAADVQMHESTVSRVTANKYLATEYGMFELKYFFSGALSSQGGDDIAAGSVKTLIKKYISEEDPKNPLSDDTLAEKIKADLKVDIARRTVAKYRTAMDIASSSKRRQRL